jgi:hypothetical protein
LELIPYSKVGGRREWAIQWYFEGKPIAGVTEASLVILADVGDNEDLLVR